MSAARTLDPSLLRLDSAAATAAITETLRTLVYTRLRRKGAVVGISGGIDSAVVTFLCSRAFGPENVQGLLMPERHSSPDTLRLSTSVAEGAGVSALLEEITPLLDAAGCYTRQEEAVKRVVPEYGPGCRFKIVLPSVVDDDRYRVSSVVVAMPDGSTITRRMPLDSYLQVVAATNFKQRCRKMIEYYHADRRAFAVTGTPNRLEYDQGFFVKGGDGLADVKPIAHLYKSQVYELAAYLGVPEEVRRRPPTTDTFSLPQGQDEFYFSLPYAQMDLCLYARNHGFTAEETASAVGITPEQVTRVFRDIDGKRRTTRPLHLTAQLIEPVELVEP